MTVNSDLVSKDDVAKDKVDRNIKPQVTRRLSGVISVIPPLFQLTHPSGEHHKSKRNRHRPRSVIVAKQEFPSGND